VIRSVFVTGTDTGVGKTTVSVGLLGAWRRRQHRVAAIKPAETGCLPRHGEALWPEDAGRLRDAAGLTDQPIDVICPNRYEIPAAPSVAGRREHRPFDLDAVLRSRDALARRDPELLLVEGAGGLLVPYGNGATAVDLALALRPISMLVVARAGLGTINHTALTIAVCRRRELPVVGVVLNRVRLERDPSEDDNAAEIEALTGTPVLGTVEHLPDPSATDLGALIDAVERALDVEALFAALAGSTRPARA
jgi:dethiobiotin synthetase